MRSEAVLYVPSDTPEAMALATRHVAGVPLIVRGIMTLAHAGVKRVVLLIARSQREAVERFLKRYHERRLPQIDILAYDEPYRLSPALVEAILERVDDRFFLINANLLFDEELVQTMRQFAVHGHDLLLCHEGVHPLPFVMLARPSLGDLISFTGEKPRSIESCLGRLVETSHHLAVQKPPTANTFLLKRPQVVPVAEKFLAEAIRLATGGPVAKHINKRFSLPVSLILAKLWISPNTITALNICIGLLSGVFVADGHHYGVILLGATLFQLASVADGCDGEVAKLTFRTSRFGQVIDTVSDNLTLASLMIGMMAGYWRQTHEPIAFVIGGTMIVATIITLALMVRTLKQRTDSASLVAYDKEYVARLGSTHNRWVIWFIGWSKYTIKKDFFSFAVFAFAVFGVLYWWLFITTFGAVVAAATTTYLALSDRRAAHGAAARAAAPITTGGLREPA